MSEQLATNMSPAIGQLAAALAAAQGEITGARKDSENPFFKSSYADLAACWDACRMPLSKNGLAVIQTTEESPEGVKVLTTLAHKSGEWIRGQLFMKPVKSDPQGIGSCITYARRYALAGIVGIAQVDDDANQASGKGKADTKGPAKQVDIKVRDSHINAFMTALNADEEESEVRDKIYAIHVNLLKDADMYNAVWEQIGSKDRKALKQFIELGKAAC